MRDYKTGLYPLSEPLSEGTLEVGGGHMLYYATYGAEGGAPVVYLHGGPGGGTKPKHAQYFNPEKYRVIVFDQRGSGQSTPLGSLENNTTQHLIQDVETLRAHLGIETWHVFGGSWGSTLALLYAEAHPQAVMSLVVYGIFLADKYGSDWLNVLGQNALYPEEYEIFCKAVLTHGHTDVRQAVIDGLLNGDKARQKAVSSAFSAWHLAGMAMGESDYMPPEEEAMIEAEVLMNRLSAHYEAHHFFVEEGQILKNIHKLKGIKGHIIQGRFDLCCPPVSAYKLHKAWPESTLTMVQEASHSTSEPLFSQALVHATDDMIQHFTK